MWIIGLVGGSGSGKTTLSNQLKEIIPDLSVIGLDSYYRDGSGISMEERTKVNYDHPDAIEYPLLKKHLQQLKKGESVCVPHYDYKSMTRKKDCTMVYPSEYVLIEGVLLNGDQELIDILDYIFFLDIDEETRLERNCKRDIASRGRTREQVIERFDAVVNPMHYQFVEPYKKEADFLIKIDTPIEEVEQKILSL